MLEIYNEEIRDLLGKGLPVGKKHNVSHDEKKGTTQVSYMECVDCKNPGKVKVNLALDAYAALLPRNF
jgi:kinesin family member C1